MRLPVCIPGLVAAVGLAVAGDLPVEGLVALADPGRYCLDRLAARQPIGDLDPVILAEEPRADRRIDEATRPASMNHSDPQLSDTPTRCDASDPDNPDRVSSK